MSHRPVLSGDSEPPPPIVLLDRLADSESVPLLGVVRFTLQIRRTSANTFDCEVTGLSLRQTRVSDWRNTQIDAEDALRGEARVHSIMDQEQKILTVADLGRAARHSNRLLREPQRRELCNHFAAAAFGLVSRLEGSVPVTRAIDDVSFGVSYHPPVDPVAVLLAMQGKL